MLLVHVYGLFVVMSCPARSQTERATPTFGDSMREFASFFAPLVFPKVIQDDALLKEYVRSDEFARLRREAGDLCAVDALFTEAMRLSWNNAYEALFITLLATMDHRRFGVKVPLLGPLLWVPLTAEFPDEFQRRIDALPRRLYDDSPVRGAGDRDKLQHFFGSAFITYLFESRAAAERMGEFIEWGEEQVIVDGSLDERDFRANRQGQQFGLRLLEEKGTLPSAFFRFVLAQGDSLVRAPGDPRCGVSDSWEMR
jgi:hypothetical protein